MIERSPLTAEILESASDYMVVVVARDGDGNVERTEFCATGAPERALEYALARYAAVVFQPDSRLATASEGETS